MSRAYLNATNTCFGNRRQKTEKRKIKKNPKSKGEKTAKMSRADLNAIDQRQTIVNCTCVVHNAAVVSSFTRKYQLHEWMISDDS